MKSEDIFNLTMSLIDEITDTGTIDPTSTAEYRAKAPSILTVLQNEIIGIENRSRKHDEIIYPVPITSLDQPVQIDEIKANTLLPYGLASHLLLDENKPVASFFQERYEEMKGIYLKPEPVEKEKIEDVYDSTLSY